MLFFLPILAFFLCIFIVAKSFGFVLNFFGMNLKTPFIYFVNQT